MKTTLYAEDVVAAWLARHLERPVKWTADRMEEFLSATHGRDLASRATLALDEDGKICALRVHSHANLGAYATPAGVVIQLLIGPWVSTSIYDIGTIDVRIEGVLTNTTPTGPYRGAGRPEAIYTIERLLDAAARKSGIDRVELRRRNMVRPVQMPYKNAMGKTYDTGQFERVLDLGLAHAEWDGFAARAARSKAKGRLRGRGIATFVEWTGADVFEEQVTITVADGTIEIFSATQPMGTSLSTTFTQLAVDVFGVPPERIRFAYGDTDRGTGFGSAGSRSLFVGGSAVHVASERTVKKAHELAAEELEAALARHRVSRRRVPHRGHRSRDRHLRPRRQAAGEAHRVRLHEQGRGRDVAERLSRVRSRDRPRHRQRRSRRTTGRSTTSDASSIRWSCQASSKAAPRRASGRRCARRWSTSASRASRSPARSSTTRCRARRRFATSR